MTMKVAGMGDLLCWLLPMGDEVRVIKPKLLIDEMVEISQSVMRQYRRSKLPMRS